MIGYFRINSKYYNLNLELNNKITILNGDSAIGKSQILTLYDDYLRGLPGVYIDASNPVETRSLTVLKYSGMERFIFLIDENFKLNNESIINLINKSNSLFILINREFIPELNYSMDDIYTLIRQNEKYVTKRSYQKSDIFNKNTKNIIKDSKSGFEFYNNILNNCISSYGNSNIVKYLKDYDNCNVIFDALSIGPYI